MRSIQVHDPAANRHRDGLSAVVNGQLGQDVLYVSLNGLVARLSAMPLVGVPTDDDDEGPVEFPG